MESGVSPYLVRQSSQISGGALGGELHDVVFVLDSSASISANSWELQKQGAINTFYGSNAFLPVNGTVAISIVLFADSAVTEVPLTVLDTPATASALAATISGIAKVGVYTQLAAELRYAVDELRRGAGPNRIIVVSTDLIALDQTSRSLGDQIRTGTGYASGLGATRICTVMIKNDSPCSDPPESTPNDDLRRLANTLDAPAPQPYLDQPIGHFSCAYTATNPPDPSAVLDFVLLCRECGCSVLHVGETDCQPNGVPDVCEPACGVAGAPPLECDPTGDPDGDGIPNATDNCPCNSNPSQVDSDGDGIGDACDTCHDSDGDGYGDPGHPENRCVTDLCPAVPSFDNGDSDGDGIGNACDNCPNHQNANQADFDGDGVGDECDNCRTTPNPRNAVPTDCNGDGQIYLESEQVGKQCDSDGDQVGDACDNCRDFGNPYHQDCNGDNDWNDPGEGLYEQCDADGDGVGDICDPLQIVEWRSVRSHSGGVDRAIILNPTATGNGLSGPTVEPRIGGIQRIQIKFDGAWGMPDSPDTGNIDMIGQYIDDSNEPVVVSYSPTSSRRLPEDPSVLEMEFVPPLPNQGCYRIAIWGDGTVVHQTIIGDNNVYIRGLVGDANSDGQVVLGDALFTKARVNLNSADAPRYDVNLSGGLINLGDAIRVKLEVKSPVPICKCPDPPSSGNVLLVQESLQQTTLLLGSEEASGTLNITPDPVVKSIQVTPGQSFDIDVRVASTGFETAGMQAELLASSDNVFTIAGPGGLGTSVSHHPAFNDNNPSDPSGWDLDDPTGTWDSNQLTGFALKLPGGELTSLTANGPYGTVLTSDPIVEGTSRVMTLNVTVANNNALIGQSYTINLTGLHVFTAEGETSSCIDEAPITVEVVAP